MALIVFDLSPVKKIANNINIEKSNIKFLLIFLNL